MGSAGLAASGTALADSDETIGKILSVSQHNRKKSVDLKIFFVVFILSVTPPPARVAKISHVSCLLRGFINEEDYYLRCSCVCRSCYACFRAEIGRAHV